MSRQFVDYDRVAEGYDERYAQNRLDGIATALLEQFKHCAAESLVDIGCGTGRWLSELAPWASCSVGLDRSLPMLLQVPGGEGRTSLVCGSAEELPLRAESVDFVSCVNAVHHLAAPAAFVSNAARLLRPRGSLAVVGLDPHQDRDRWYLYDYFPEARELDLQRYPSAEQLVGWMIAADLEPSEVVAVERIRKQYKGREILEDYFLQRKASSQLAILSEEAWAEGLQRIRQAVQEGEARDSPPVFEVDLNLCLVGAWKPPTKCKTLP